MNKLFSVSIVICTYNGAGRILDCLNTLQNLDYPKNLYEIIVVNDGSTDDTGKILDDYPYKVITHPSNQGICAARNTGWKNSSKEIVAYTDDDCLVDRSWLKNLVKHYRKDVIAVGGITYTHSLKTLMEKYMAETGYGNPAPIEFAASNNPLHRFWIYYRNMLHPLAITDKDPVRVRNIYTLNASYRRSILSKISGFSSGFNFREDTELCDRLNNKYPKKSILFTQKAVIVHKHRTSIWHFVKQTFYRSENTLKCYLQDGRIPPIYPFPVFWVILIIASIIINPLMLIICIFVLPQVFYCWWPIKLIKKGDYSLILFPYMQLILEISEISGMLRGYLINRFNINNVRS